MVSFEEVKKFLPKYLSSEAERKLFSELEHFPENIDKRFYSYFVKKEHAIFQGDGIADVMVINLPEMVTKNVPVMIISNTCDINQTDQQLYLSRIVYAPIFNLEKYASSLIDEGLKNGKSIDNHVNDIRKQSVSQIFYLPAGGDLIEESIVFLDRLNNLPVGFIPREQISKRKIFSLSDYGFYIFLFKLSIHFTRIREGFERGIDVCNQKSF
jgi:hypothetical protein